MKSFSAKFLVGVTLLASFIAAGLVAHGQAKDQTKEQTKTEKKQARKSSAHQRFLRVRVDRKGRPVAMETSIVRYQVKNEQGKNVTVDLIGAVHIGEGEYFKRLNEEFEKYDSLLYELVAPEAVSYTHLTLPTKA